MADPIYSFAVDASGLKAEFNQDLSGLGYQPFISGMNSTQLANLVNKVGSGAGYVVFRNDVAPREVINAVATADFRVATQIAISKLQILFQAAPLDCVLSGMRNNIQSIFSGSASDAGIQALFTRQGSRAEILWGTGSNVAVNDCGTLIAHWSGTFGL